MSQNVFDFDHVRQLEVLIKELGVDECKRLGFVYIDEQGIMSMTPVGHGYLLFVKAANVTTLPEAFSAGWQCAWDMIEDEGEE